MLSKTSTALLALASSAMALNTLKVDGANFVDSVTGQRFEIIGVDYQPGGSDGFKPQTGVDPLSDGKACLRDAILMQQLGLNCIRVYNLDPQINHDACVSTFAAAGIYMILDVNSPLSGQSINAGDPASSYNADYLNHIFQVVENFMGYDNLLGFFAGNEVINDDVSGGIDPPYVRAVTRDLKNYIAKNAKRTIPVGYSAAQVEDILLDNWQYVQCSMDGTTTDPSRSDFFGLNSYSWCGSDATFQSSGYDVLTEQFANTSIPVFFSEYGCNQIPVGTSRPFDEVQALYGEPMRGVFSGGLVYEWTQEANDFGLVNLTSSGDLQLRQDYVNLQSQLNKLDISAIVSANPSATAATPPSCTPALITGGTFNSSFTLPTAPPGVSNLIASGATGSTVAGSLASVTATAMPVQVSGADGSAMSNLNLRIVNGGQNLPGGQQGGNSTSGSGSPGASSSAFAAPTAGPALGLGVAAVGGVLLGAVLL